MIDGRSGGGGASRFYWKAAGRRLGGFGGSGSLLGRASLDHFALALSIRNIRKRNESS